MNVEEDLMINGKEFYQRNKGKDKIDFSQFHTMS